MSFTPYSAYAARRGVGRSKKAALWAAGNGWAVAPGVPGSKHPYNPDHPEGKEWQKIPVRTPEEIDKENWRNKSVHVITEPSGLVDFETDQKNVDGEASWDEIDPGIKTMEMVSQSGSHHHIFRAGDFRAKTEAGQIAKGLDVRGIGGQFTIYDPSEETPRSFNDLAPSMLPVALAGITPVAGSYQPTRELQDKVRLDFAAMLADGIPEGKQDDTLTRYAYKMTAPESVFTKESALLALIALVRSSKTGVDAKGKTREPFDLKHLEGYIDSAIAKHEKETQTSIKTGKWLKEQTFPPLAFAVPILIPEGLTLLAGSPKTGKSLLALQVSLACSTGGILFGEKCIKRPVIYLALEDDDRNMQERCLKMLGGSRDSIPDKFGYLTHIDKRVMIPTVAAWIKKHPDGIIIIDTLARAMEPARNGEGAYERDVRIVSSLADIAHSHMGCSIMIVTHTRKAKSDDPLERVSGTYGVTGSIDTTLVLDRKRGQQAGIISVISRKIPDDEFAMELKDPYGWSVVGANLTEASLAAQLKAINLGPRSTDLLKLASEHPEGINAEIVSQKLGMIPKDAGTYLLRNYEAGYLSRIGRGLYGPA